MHYHSKQILVLGLGRSGLAATRLLQQAGASVTVADSGGGEALQQHAEALRAEGVSVHLGEKALSFLQSSAFSLQPLYARAILSPGIEPTSPLVQQVVACGVPLVGELELAYDFCKCPIVAITGTNGKTTTTELTVAGLLGAGLKTIACGNIGLPFSEAVVKSAELDVIVIEVSSFQLETTDRFHAHVAVWLNLSPNHLDRYASVAEYREAKLRIFRNQKSDDIVIIPKNFDSEGLFPLIAKKITFSSQDAEADFFFDGESISYRCEPLLEMSQTELRGAHNAENIMAALAVGVALNVAPQKMLKGISTYRSLPHRCEVVMEQEGVLWINDSKSTTLDAMEKALRSIEKKRRIILIAGGKNKGTSFSSILPLVQERVKEAILLGEMKRSIAESWHGVVSHQVNSMEEAVQLAAAHAEPGDVVLLSPGSSSYDMFKNYEERGNQFKKAVLQLLKSKSLTS
ncbi:MAG: UDP-N-acetylmuramoyl-L-alanine--D-glutamate ligase [Verrucomicrobiae bacterium]|nr:UDP-N-acetylmuramoyl-L-alanine--D-glutamate ligase [Verrucomicrobiae bacterium]